LKREEEIFIKRDVLEKDPMKGRDFMKQFKRYGAEQKVRILREILQNGKKTSEVSEEYGISSVTLYEWQKQLFEGAVDIFGSKEKGSKKLQTKVKRLEEILSVRNELISELVTENITMKKKRPGEI